MNITKNTIGFGLSVAVLGAMGAALAPQAEAATVYARNGAFNFAGQWQFDYMKYDYANTSGIIDEGTSYGSYRSGFGVTPPANAAPLIIEKDNKVPGDCKPGKCGGLVNFATDDSLAQFFYVTYKGTSDTDPTFAPKLTSGTKTNNYIQPRPQTGAYNGFLVLNRNNYLSVTQMPGNYLGTSTDLPIYQNRLRDTAILFFGDIKNSNSRLIAVNDPANDTDFQDMIISARPVPLPLMAPGLALAGAFFAYRRKGRSVA